MSREEQQNPNEMLLSAMQKAHFCMDRMRISFFLDMGADINYKHRSFQGSTLLMLCVAEGPLETVQALLDEGANVNHVNKFNRTALHHCYSDLFLSKAKLLLDYGAIDSLFIRNRRGRTPWDEAIFFNESYEQLRSLYIKSIRNEGIIALLFGVLPKNRSSAIQKAYYRNYLCEYQLLPYLARYLE